MSDVSYHDNCGGPAGSPICKVSDDLYIGAFVIFGDVELTVKTAEALLKKAPEYDYMISPRPRGSP